VHQIHAVWAAVAQLALWAGRVGVDIVASGDPPLLLAVAPASVPDALRQVACAVPDRTNEKVQRT